MCCIKYMHNSWRFIIAFFSHYVYLWNLQVWKKGITSPPETVLFNETGTYTTPTAPFAFMYIEEQHLASADEQSSDNAKNNFKMLASDPIMCQSAGGSTISFR